MRPKSLKESMSADAAAHRSPRLEPRSNSAYVRELHSPQDDRVNRKAHRASAESAEIR
jgi:hypothetical protein